MKYRIVELILIWIIYLASFGRSIIGRINSKNSNFNSIFGRINIDLNNLSGFFCVYIYIYIYNIHTH